MIKRFLIILFALSFIPGCDTGRNLIENAEFKDRSKGPERWLIDGKAEVKKPEGGTVELVPAGPGGAFLYQPIKMRRLYQGNILTLSAMVKSSSPENAALEFSDRKGRDVTSPFHPGDGRWHILKVTTKVPEGAENIEVRLRTFKSVSALFRSPHLVIGTGTPLSEDDGGENTIESALYIFAGAYFMILLTISIHFYMRRRAAGGAARVVGVFLMLVALANLMLILGRPFNAVLTSVIAWGVFLSGMVVVIAWRGDGSFVMEYLRLMIKRPASVFVVLSVLSALSVIAFLYEGSTRLAAGAARLSYIFMLIGAALAVVTRLRAVIRASGSFKDEGVEDKNLQGREAVVRRGLTLLKRR